MTLCCRMSSLYLTVHISKTDPKCPVQSKDLRQNNLKIAATCRFLKAVSLHQWDKTVYHLHRDKSLYFCYSFRLFRLFLSGQFRMLNLFLPHCES